MQQDTVKCDPYLMDILQDGLRRLHQNTESPQHDTYPDRYQRLIETQNRIGWDQLYKGRWSTHWGELQTQYSQSLNNSTKKVPSGAEWVLAMGRLLIDQWLVLWAQRNEDRHGKDERQNTLLRLHVIRSQLEELYT